MRNGGKVTFGDKSQGTVICIGKVGNPSKPIIDSVLLVEGLSFNLISISQLCDKGYKVNFREDICLIFDSCTTYSFILWLV